MLLPIFVTALVCAWYAPVAEAGFGSRGVIGSEGRDPDQLLGSSLSLEFDPAGDLYAVTGGGAFGDDTISKFKANGDFIQRFGGSTSSSGNGPGELRFPNSIAAAPSGAIYVGDTWNVQQFTADGAFVRQWGDTGDQPGQFFHINSLDTDSAGNVYVAEQTGVAGYTRQNRVQKFSPTGAFLDVWPVDRGGADALTYQFDLAIDRFDRLYLSDTANDRVLVYTAGGNLVTTWGSEGSQPGQFNVPTGIAIDPVGNVVVADSGNNRIQAFTPDGTFIAEYRPDPPKSELEFGDSFSFANDIAVDAEGTFYIPEKGTILVYGAVPFITISKGPKKRTRKRRARFVFSSDVPGSTFECKAKGGWKPCSSPLQLKRLDRGRHTFSVRGLLDDVVGPKVTHKWKVKRKKRKR